MNEHFHVIIIGTGVCQGNLQFELQPRLPFP